MFGYVTVNQGQLSEEAAKRYRACYCGLCKALYRGYGRVGQATLTYDMTFLVILLDSLYEQTSAFREARCIPHPLRKHAERISDFSAYAADMNILLSYYNFLDDWQDDRKVSGKAAAMLLSGRMKKLADRYPRQYRALQYYVQELARTEEAKDPDMEKAAHLTGQLLAEIFVCREDVWADSLRRMGMYLGKFIYLMDAFEDVDRDLAAGSYNPLRAVRDREDFSDLCKQILMMQMAECCRAFERLPLEQDLDILRNILYSGVWTKFALLYNKLHENGEET